MHTSKPDFTQYTQEELREALETIDKNQFPERVNEIESLLRQTTQDHKKSSVAKQPWSPKTEFWFCIVGGIFMLSLIADGVLTGVIWGRHGDANVEHEPLSYSILMVTYIVLFTFCLHGLFHSRKRARALANGEN